MDSGEAKTTSEHSISVRSSIGNQLVCSNSRNQVGLELVQVDVQGSIESQRSGDGRDDLSDQPVQVGVSRRLDSEVLSADVVDTAIQGRTFGARVSPSSICSRG